MAWAILLVACFLAIGGSLPRARAAPVDEAARVPAWLVQGMISSLTRDNDPVVQSEALRFPNAGSILQSVPDQDRIAVVDVLMLHLRNGDWVVRAAAAQALGAAARNTRKVGDIRKELIRLLNDDEAAVRRAAALALGILAKDAAPAADEAVDALIPALHDRIPEVRNAAIQALGMLVNATKAKIDAAVDALIQGIDDEFPFVAIAAAEAVARLGQGDDVRTSDAVGALIPLLASQISAVHIAAGRAFDALVRGDASKADDAIDYLLPFLGDGDPKKRAAAATALGPLAKGNSARIAAVSVALRSKLDDDDAAVRAAAVRAFGELASENSDQANVGVDALIPLGRDGDPAVRVAAAQGLGKLGNADKKHMSVGLDALMPLLGDKDADVRIAAAQAIDALANGDQTKRQAAVDALIVGLRDVSLLRIKESSETIAVLAAGDKQRLGAAIGALVSRFQHPSGVLFGPDELSEAAQGLAALLSRDPTPTDSVFDVTIQMLGDDRWELRHAAVQAVPVLIPVDVAKAGAAANALIDRLKDENWGVRSAAARALGAIAQALAAVASGEPGLMDASILPLISCLGDGHAEVRQAAAEALGAMPHPLSRKEITALLELAMERPADQARMEAAFHILSGGDKKLSLLLPLLRRAEIGVTQYRDREATLGLFAAVWPTGPSDAGLRLQIARHTKTIADQACAGHVPTAAEPSGWLPSSGLRLWSLVGALSAKSCFSPIMREYVVQLGRLFDQSNLVEGRDLQRLLDEDGRRKWFADLGGWVIGIIGLHTGFWIALLWLYPRYQWVQAVFFWNPRVRKLLGWHLAVLIPLLPFARRRVLAPFRSALGPRPDLIAAVAVAETAWFPDAEVTEGGDAERVPITKALPLIRGLTVLEGASGLGKTVHLVRLARDPGRTVAFINAGEEGGEVVKAIAARLPGEVVRDETFLRMLIHAGGLDICIDGLNEVSAEARAAVASFAQAATNANVLIATQPIRWTRPAGARLLRLQPLRPDQRLAFLESRESLLPDSAPLRGERYTERVRTFVRTMEETSPADIEEQVARERALSNPMDLTTITVILANDGEPDLLNLQQTVYDQAADQYSAHNQGAEFPLTAFSEHVYELRCKSSGQERELIVLREPKFAAACDALSDHRLLLRTIEPDSENREAPAWRFRHDKVLDFFLYLAVTNPRVVRERVAQHIADTRFRGVYLLLALRAPLDLAKEMRDRLTDHATDTRDHALSDEVWGIVRQRLEATVSGLPLAAEASA